MKETLEAQDKRLHEFDDNSQKQSSPLDFFLQTDRLTLPWV